MNESISKTAIELESQQRNIESIKNVINNVILEHKSKISICYTSIESCLCLEHSIYSAVCGFYSSSMESLRRYVELVVFGIYFDKDNLSFNQWLNGNSEFNFTSKLESIFKYPEIRSWSTESFYASLKTEIINIYKKLSMFTHSNPTKWEHGLRLEWELEYSQVKLNEWLFFFSKSMELCTSLLVLYLPDILDEYCSLFLNPNIMKKIEERLIGG